MSRMSRYLAAYDVGFGLGLGLITAACVFGAILFVIKEFFSWIAA